MSRRQWLIKIPASATQVRSLYAFEGQRDQDLSFEEGVLIVAHPAKDASSEWLYGMMPLNGKKGWVPKSYVETLRELPLLRVQQRQADLRSKYSPPPSFDSAIRL